MLRKKFNSISHITKVEIVFTTKVKIMWFEYLCSGFLAQFLISTIGGEIVSTESGVVDQENQRESHFSQCVWVCESVGGAVWRLRSRTADLGMGLEEGSIYRSRRQAMHQPSQCYVLPVPLRPGLPAQSPETPWIWRTNLRAHPPATCIPTASLSIYKCT